VSIVAAAIYGCALFFGPMFAHIGPPGFGVGPAKHPASQLASTGPARGDRR
jgi:hypothetical protein